MKARVKETGEIFDIECVSLRLTGKVLSSFGINDVEVLMPDLTPDYWTRLEHTYAGMAMQGLMSYVEQITPKKGRSFCDEIVDISFNVAHALVEKYKKEEK